MNLGFKAGQNQLFFVLYITQIYEFLKRDFQFRAVTRLSEHSKNNSLFSDLPPFAEGCEPCACIMNLQSNPISFLLFFIPCRISRAPSSYWWNNSRGDISLIWKDIIFAILCWDTKSLRCCRSFSWTDFKIYRIGKRPVFYFFYNFINSVFDGLIWRFIVKADDSVLKIVKV